WGWLTYRPLPAPCCRVWWTPVPYCYPPLYTFFLNTPPRCDHPGCGAIHPVSAAPCQGHGCAQSECGSGSCSGGCRRGLFSH
ncbi:MAG TPA: hypothetical protein VEL76_01045, partial [Gemmataceae bacterium]|nr:hypothetical protein [Gemmataceae bacterium]